MTNRLSTNPVAGQQGQPPEIHLFDPHAEAVPDDPVVPPSDDFDFDADTDLDTGDGNSPMRETCIQVHGYEIRILAHDKWFVASVQESPNGRFSITLRKRTS